ncbi:zinc transporter ZIP5 isoform X3 [Pleurodeles waltl]|uniref:zinc transporter ZIP5 isoform X3 n=1 Tax=Pleurodeles waltl TaxID=8319 RepID=UPI00370997BE
MACVNYMPLLSPLWLFLLIYSHLCHGDLKSNASVLPITEDAHYKGQQSILQDANANGRQAVFRNAEEEQGYYLQQLFMQYGQNGTLSFNGLTNLLQNLGLGQVQVVEIQHEDLGHGHVSHLDILEVQEQKHAHSHSSLEHAVESDINTTSSRSQAVKVWTKQTTTKPGKTHLVQSTTEAGREFTNAGNAWSRQSWSRPEQIQSGHHWARNNILEQLLLLDHSNYNHLHEDCLNVTQLLLNFGLNGIEELTPQQFSLICPALLYQIDSRVCIRHDDVLRVQQEKAAWDMAVVGFGFLAITIISVPSLLAILLVPLLSRSVFYFLLAFLVALAVGTLCGDALLHLLPHAHGTHHKVLKPRQVEAPEDSILKGLCVVAGIYLLFLIENILGLTKRRTKKKKTKSDCSGSQQASLVALRALGSTEEQNSPSSFDQEPGSTEKIHHCSLLVQAEPGEEHNNTAQSTHTSREDVPFHMGHSHGPQQTGAADISDIAWMVILGDGIHNFTDGLAIGAAFSQGIPSGLSTSIAVFCHELPHELGDFAVLLQAGMPVRRVLVFSLLSAFLGYLGMLVGTTVSQSSSKVTPWIFAGTAGIFLYVALVDMLPDMLQRDPAGRGKTKIFFLRNFGFLLGTALMLCIALFEDGLQFLIADL